MTLKLTFYYNQGKQGFTETFYASGADPQAYVFNTLSTSLLRKLAAIRSMTTSMYAVRASVVDNPRNSYLRLINGEFSGSGGFGGLLDVPDVVSTDAVIQLTGSGAIKRRLFLRGLRDDWVVRDALGNDKPPAGFTTQLNNYFNAIQAAGFQIRVTVLPPAGGLVWQNVFQVIEAVPGSGSVQLQTAGVVAAPFVKGAYVVIQGAPAQTLPRFPRIAQITAVGDAGTPGIFIAYHKLSGGNVTVRKMRFAALTYSYEPITSYQFERFSEHRTGKPFGLLRGRSRGLARVS